jgi:hypothetical protein
MPGRLRTPGRDDEVGGDVAPRLEGPPPVLVAEHLGRRELLDRMVLAQPVAHQHLGARVGMRAGQVLLPVGVDRHEQASQPARPLRRPIRAPSAHTQVRLTPS